MNAVVQKKSFGVNDLDEFRARLVLLSQEHQAPTEVTDYLAYTDGACFGNPSGPGGWAAAVSSAADERTWELWGHLSSTSNNRAEALGVLGALEWVPAGSRLTVRSDSQLTVRIFEGHYKVKANPDIWEAIVTTRVQKSLVVRAEWLRGHVGDVGNELADRLSKLGALNGDLAGLEAILELPPRTDTRRVAPPRAAETAAPELDGLEPQTGWEREFVRSVAKQLRGGRELSDKQRQVIAKIRAKASRPSAS